MVPRVILLLLSAASIRAGLLMLPGWERTLVSAQRQRTELLPGQEQD